MTTSTASRIFLRRKEAAAACGVCVDLIDAAIRAGRLRAKKTAPRNGNVLIRPADLEAWFEQLTDADDIEDTG